MCAQRRPETAGAPPSVSPGTADAPTLQARFNGVLGDRRGLTDVRAALARLGATERELDHTQREALALHEDYEHLANDVTRLNDLLKEQADELEYRCIELRVSQSDRARAHYALVRATGTDISFRTNRPVHHGVWTPGLRSYLCDEHVYGPVDGCCYIAHPLGVAPGHEPGVSDYWKRCAADAGCPEPEPVPVRAHPVDGHALRQDEFWWDAKMHKHALHELTDEHIQGVIAWLSNHSPQLWVAELDEARVYVPCPAQAYANETDWLADTPLWRALNVELARRGLAESETPATDAHADEGTGPGHE